MKNTVFPHKFWRPFLDCMPQLFFRPQYVWFPVHLKGILIPLCYKTLVVNWQNWFFTLFHQSRSVLSPTPITWQNLLSMLKDTWHVEFMHHLQPPEYPIIFFNRFHYMNDNGTKSRSLISLDIDIMLGLLQTTMVILCTVVIILPLPIVVENVLLQW